MKYKLSVVGNVCFLAVALFLAGKRSLFQRHQYDERRVHSYLDNAQYIEQVNIQSAYNKPAKILFLGNSHVYKARWDELLDRGDVAVRGIGSDVTQGYIHRLDQVLAAHPRVVFVEGGANDLYYHVPADSIIANMTVIIDFLKANNVIPVLHQLPPVAKDEPTASTYNVQVRELNTRIAQLARANNLQCIDLYTLLSQDGYLADRFHQPDGVHLTGDAYKAWAVEVNTVLRRLEQPQVIHFLKQPPA